MSAMLCFSALVGGLSPNLPSIQNILLIEYEAIASSQGFLSVIPDILMSSPSPSSGSMWRLRAKVAESARRKPRERNFPRVADALSRLPQKMGPVLLVGSSLQSFKIYKKL